MEKENEMGVEVDETRLLDTEEFEDDTQGEGSDADSSMRSRAHLVRTLYHYLPL